MDAQIPPEELERLITLSQSGDVVAFGDLVAAHQAWLRGWLRGQLSDWTVADDLAQDAFVTAFKKIRDYRGEGSFQSWLCAIAHNHFRNHIRKKREHCIGGDLELQNLLVVDESESDYAGPEVLQTLKDCMEKLDGPSRGLIEDRYMRGHTVREIAAREQKGYSSLTMRLHRLRKVLATCIEKNLT